MQPRLTSVSLDQTTASEGVLSSMVLGVSHQQAVYRLAVAVDFSAHYARWLQKAVKQPSPPLRSQITLRTLHVSGWKLLRSLDLFAVCEREQWVVSDDIFGIYGVGDEPAEALRDYESTLVRFYVDIAEWEGSLSPHLDVQKEHLAQYVARGDD